MIKPLKRKAYLIKSLNQQWSQKCRSISIRRIVIRWIVVSRQNDDLGLSWRAIPTRKDTRSSCNCRVQLPFRIPNRSKHVWKVGWWLSTLATVFIVTTDFLRSYWSGPLDALFEVDNGSLRILFQLSDQRFRELFLVRLRSHMPPPIMGLLWYGLSLITCKGSDEFSCHSFTTATTSSSSSSLAVRILSMSLDIKVSTWIKKTVLVVYFLSAGEEVVNYS